MIGFLHKERTSASMTLGIDLLQLMLGHTLFSRICSLVLADRGSEFEIWKLFERDSDGKSRLSMFYCDPMQSSQKPHVENNHNYVRDILQNSLPMDSLTQQDMDRMFSHINSTPRLSLGDRTPYETFCYFYGDKALAALPIQEIPRDQVVLKPWLIYANR